MIPMKKTPLSKLATVSAGQAAPKDDEFSDHGIPFVRAGSLDRLLSGKSESDLELVGDETAKLRKLKTYPKGTILFAKSGMSATKDRIYVLQNPAYVVSHLATLIPNDNAHADYLRLALKRFPPSVLIKDPSYPSISLGEIQSYEIPVPEQFDDQKRLVHLIGKVEVLIARRKQHLQQLDDLLKSIFLEMFGDPVRNVKGWEKASVSHFIKQGVVLEVQDGNHGNDHPKVSDFSDTGLPFVTANVVRDGKILFNKCYYLSTDWLKKLRIGFAHPGDVLLSHKGTLGATAILDDSFETYIFSPQTTYYRVNQRRLLPEYLQAYFDSDYFQWLLKKEGAVQATRAYIGITKQKNLPLMLPPIEYQNQFIAVYEKFKALKSRYQQNLTDLESLNGVLSQQAFKGELDLSRVIFPKEQKEFTEGVDTEITTLTDISAIPSIELPNPAVDADLTDPKGRLEVIGFWLDSYLEQLGDLSFSANKFTESAQQKLWELLEDDAYQLSVAEYDHVKVLIFKAIEVGRLAQSYDDDKNLVQIMAARG